MSYILDALKKAEAERNQGAVPNVHASPVFTGPVAGRSPAWRKPWPWVGLAVLAAGALALYKPWESAAPAPQDMPPVAAALPAQTPAPAPVASDAGSPAAGVPATRTPDQATAPAAGSPAAGSATGGSPASGAPAAPPPTMMPAPPSAPPKEPAAPKSAPVPQKAKPAAETVPQKDAVQKEAPQVAAKSAAPPAQEAKAAKEPKPADRREAIDETRIATLRELPQDIQSQIPPLTVNGYIYSDKPAERTVLINQRLLREGEQVAPDLRLEKLTPSGMVLNFRGHRYRTSYK